jgi:hypothetical protein
MKWQRGLFRLWIVLSVCWIVAVGAFTWVMLPADDWVPVSESPTDQAGSQNNNTADDKFEPSKPTFDPSKPFYVPVSETAELFKKAAVLALVPPTIILALGAALAWTINGFRATSHVESKFVAL